MGKTLIIYNSRSGNTLRAAKVIQEKTGGDLYEIKPQKKQNIFALFLSMAFIFAFGKSFSKEPIPLINDFPNLESYDQIYVGGPIYAGTLSPALNSFLYQTDFKGKLVFPFATYGGGERKYFKKFKIAIKNAYILDGFKGWAFNMEKADIEAKIAEFVSYCKNYIFVKGGGQTF